MEATSYAVERLTMAHTVDTEGRLIEWPPLLVWLETRVTEIVGRKGGGASGTGVPLNVDALELLQRIDRRLKQLLEALYLRGSADRVADVRLVWEQTRLERAGGRMDDDQWELITAELQGWVHAIEAEDDRPRKMELTVPCPRCGERWMLDELGQRVAAVVVEFSEGRAPIAECRRDVCGALWVGWADVARLGFTVGAVQDGAVLAACGVDAPQMLGVAEV